MKSCVAGVKAGHKIDGKTCSKLVFLIYTLGEKVSRLTSVFQHSSQHFQNPGKNDGDLERGIHSAACEFKQPGCLSMSEARRQ